MAITTLARLRNVFFGLTLARPQNAKTREFSHRRYVAGYMGGIVGKLLAELRVAFCRYDD